jgi:hypothetical protein
MAEALLPIPCKLIPNKPERIQLLSAFLRQAVCAAWQRVLNEFKQIFRAKALEVMNGRAASQRPTQGLRRVFALNFGSEILGWRDGALAPLARVAADGAANRVRGVDAIGVARLGGRLWRQRRERAAELVATDVGGRAPGLASSTEKGPR